MSCLAELENVNHIKLLRKFRHSLTDSWEEFYNIINNTDLWRENYQIPAEDEINQQRWKWIGHTLCKPTFSVTSQALCWNPQGKGKRGQPRNTWHYDHEVDIRKTGHSWGQLERMAQNKIFGRLLLMAYAQGGVMGLDRQVDKSTDRQTLTDRQVDR